MSIERAAGPPEKKPAKRPGRDEPGRHLDAWLIWIIAVGAIVLPGLVLICESSVPAGQVRFTALADAAGRGEFLGPVMILCAETIRRWTRGATGRSVIRTARVAACALCIPAICICLSTSVITATLTSAAASRSTAIITMFSLVIAAVFGTSAVVIPDRGRQ